MKTTLKNPFFNKIILFQVRRVIRRASSLWSKSSGLRFRETKQSEISDLRFGFKYRLHEDGFSNAFDGPGGALAHAFFPKRGEAHFDIEEKWASGLLKNHGNSNGRKNKKESRRSPRSVVSRDRASLLAVAAHEMGHMLGLPHSPVRGALMSPFYREFVIDFELAIRFVKNGKTADYRCFYLIFADFRPQIHD